MAGAALDLWLVSINFTHLRSFHVVAEARSFSVAARRLNISQSTLTRQVSQLESDYKTRLFERTTRRVELTQEGYQLLEYCEPVFRQLADAESFLKAQTARRVLIHSVQNSAVSDLVSTIVSSFPTLRCEVKIERSQQVLGSLTDRKCDFGLLTLDEANNDLEYRRIRTERLRPLLPDAVTGGRRTISIRDLDGKRVIVASTLGRSRELFDRTIERLSVNLASIIEVDSNELIWDLVQKGVGIGVIASTGLIENALKQDIQFEESGLEIDVHFACRKDRLRTSLFRLIFDLALRKFSEYEMRSS